MKANQKFLIDNERGDIGVGTLIIFIAMVLVAAVAATVLIYTTGALQQKATKTSKDATQQISSNIVVEQVLGDRGEPINGTMNQSINDLLIRLKPDVGTTSIDLRQVIVTVMDSTQRFDLNYSSIAINVTAMNNTTQYNAIAVRDEDQSFTNYTPVLNSGDLIEIQISSNAIQGIILAPRKTFWLSLNQELGQAVNLEIATPNSFGVNRYVRLYP
ncbi:MAG: archaellin/type IV pilin N-terminal domain-containing protein [Candidatus Methanoperedens sp.]